MLEDKLKELWHSGNFPYSLLIVGKNDENHKRALFNFINYATKKEHSVPSTASPDVFLVEKDPASKHISIEQVRELTTWNSKSAMLSRHKFAIICAAEHMTFSAINACLKVLEEPGENSHFFITSSAPKALPKTILSRCWILNNPCILKSSAYKQLIKNLLDSNLEEIQKSLTDASIQAPMKHLLSKWAKYRAMPGLEVDQEEEELFSKLPKVDLIDLIEIADNINEKIQTHLSMSFEAKHIARLVLWHLGLDG